MRTLIVHHNAGRVVIELGRYCRNALAQLGHPVEIFNFPLGRLARRMPFLEPFDRRFSLNRLRDAIGRFRPDLVLVIKGDALPPDVLREIKREKPVILANYWIDDPHYRNRSTKISPLYDHFFTNAASCVEAHRAAGCPHAGFLSFGCDARIHRTRALSARETEQYGCDVCFSGTLDEKRLRTLESLAGCGLKIHSARFYNRFENDGTVRRIPVPPGSPVYRAFTGSPLWGEELVAAYNAAKIVVNIHSPQDTPIMRDFEATGCGSFLLTDPADGLETMFVPGEEIAVFRSAGELRELVDHYITAPELRRTIARNGQRRCYAEHTYERRMKELLSFIQQ